MTNDQLRYQVTATTDVAQLRSDGRGTFEMERTENGKVVEIIRCNMFLTRAGTWRIGDYQIGGEEDPILGGRVMLPFTPPSRDVGDIWKAIRASLELPGPDTIGEA